ncbi:hypothetical protein C0995_016007 [Termitomyces sp. Mi166|nr:hypothetical protein C0995_016007 [Termitomyces sp. Mi166\
MADAYFRPQSVLSEVYAADKAAQDKVPSSTINEAAPKFAQASRQDLADGLLREAEIIENFLPPLLSDTDIDEALRQAIAALPAEAQPQKSRGQIFKNFYQRIDRSTVDTSLVKQRADALLTQN